MVGSLVVATALSLGAVLASAPPVLAVPKVIVAPSNGFAGATVKATATGFPVGPVTFWWDSITLLGTAQADAQKAILNFQIPSGAAPGEHFVRACSLAACPPDGVFDDGKVTVVAPTPPPATPSPTPSPTPPPTPVPTPGPPTPTPRPSPMPRTTSAPSGPIAPGGATPTVAAGTPTPPDTSGAPTGDPSTLPSPSALVSSSPPPSPDPLASPSAIAAAPTESNAPSPVDPASASSGLPGGPIALVMGLLGVLAVVGAGLLAARRRSTMRRVSSAPSPGASPPGAPAAEPAPSISAAKVPPKTISIHVEELAPPG